MKKVAVLYDKHSPLIDAISYQLQDYELEFFTSAPNGNNFDLVVLAGYKKPYDGNTLKCHYSLLPAFESEEPLKDAILSGAKVTGITIYFTNPKRIIAQYPIFVTNEKHYDDLYKELQYIEQTIFPLVIKKVLDNEPFEINCLLNKCQNKCSGGCSGCNH